MIPTARLSLLLWALVPVVFPIYLFDSGAPQISTAVVGLASVAALTAGFRIPVEAYPFMKYLAWFLWYICIVNFAWAALLGDYWMVRPPVFYLYNGWVLTLGVFLYERAGVSSLRLTQHAFAFAVLSQLLLLLILGPSTGRESIYFNDPNQLGYFALVSAAVVLTLSDRLGTPTWYRGATLGMCLVLVMVSSSFSALAGFGLLIVMALIRRPGMIAIAVLVFGLFLTIWEADLFLSKRVESERLEREESSFSFLASRGYDRISNYPEHVVLGAGEGNYRARTSVIGKHEIHSSLGTLLFCYGIIGTAFFIVFIAIVSRTAGLRYAQYLFPVLLYGIAHQALRSTMLWFFIAVLYGVGRFPEPSAGSIIRERKFIHWRPNRSTALEEVDNSI